MNDVLHRLVVQAIDAGSTNVARIRAAVSVNAPVPFTRAAAEPAASPGLAWPGTTESRNQPTREHFAPEASSSGEHVARVPRMADVGKASPVAVAPSHDAPPRTAARSVATRSETPVPIDSPAAFPNPLLPVSPSLSPILNITPRPVPAVPIATTRSAAEQNTEVHVHIGRIEVRASQEAAPAKAARPSRRTRSLTDYLVRRSNP